MFELKKSFTFHRTPAVDVQSIFVVLQFIYDFLASDNTVRRPVDIFPTVSLNAGFPSPIVSVLLFNSSAEDMRMGSISLLPWSLWALMLSTQIRFCIE